MLGNRDTALAVQRRIRFTIQTNVKWCEFPMFVAAGHSRDD